MAFKLIYTTLENAQDAKDLVRLLLEKKLIACGNIIKGVTSWYEWKGTLCEAEEVILILKTQESCVKEIEKTILEKHSYECPCFLVLPIEQGNPKFLKWIEAATFPGEVL
jgi:periplasmic divalent cation tolerance protein